MAFGVRSCQSMGAPRSVGHCRSSSETAEPALTLLHTTRQDPARSQEKRTTTFCMGKSVHIRPVRRLCPSRQRTRSEAVCRRLPHSSSP